jgi:hypothetical protein
MSEDNGKLNVEDPMKGSVIITIIQSPEKPIRIESNAATEGDLLSMLFKASVAACLESLIFEEDDEEI